MANDAKKNSTQAAFKVIPENENPFSKMDHEDYETAQILCAGLKSFARQLSPLLKGKCVIIFPDGDVKAADLVTVRTGLAFPKANA